MPDSTYTTTHVYVKVHDGLSLMPKFTGPWLIVDRPSNSTIKIKTGTFADGSARLERVHWSNARPAYVGSDTPDAVRPKLGRPPKTPLHIPAPDDVLTCPVVINSEEPPTEQTSEPVELSAPNSNDETPSLSSDQSIPPITVQQTASRPQRSTRGVPPPKFQDYYTYSNTPWSANAQEIAALNYQISNVGPFREAPYGPPQIQVY